MSDIASSSSVQPDGAPPTVTDRRPVPRGVLPRGVQTWLMAGLAVGMLAIMLIVGRPDPPPRAAQAAAPSAGAQRRSRARLPGPPAPARGAGGAAGPGATPVAPAEPAEYQRRRLPPPAQDPIADERRRREYESLFASNVVLSRRPDARTARPRAIGDVIDRASADVGAATPIGRRRSPTPSSAPRRGPQASLAQEATPTPGPAPRRRCRPLPRSRSARARRRLHAAHQRRRAAVPRSRGHRHRHRPDESARWRDGGPGELPRDERALLAHGPAGAHPSRRASPRRDEARAGLRRDAPGRVVPPPADARRAHVPASISSWDSTRSATRASATRSTTTTCRRSARRQPSA